MTKMTQTEQIKRIADKCKIEVVPSPPHNVGWSVKKGPTYKEFNPFTNADQLLDCIERLGISVHIDKMLGRNDIWQVSVMDYPMFMVQNKDLRTALGEALYKYCEK